MKTKDQERYDALNGDRCQICYARGADKRNLVVECFYAVNEVVPEAIDLSFKDERGYFLRICKTCRGEFLRHMKAWADDRRKLRCVEKDHDGAVLENVQPGLSNSMRCDDPTITMSGPEYDAYLGVKRPDPAADIPVRVFGATRMVTREEWDQMQLEMKAG
jgi:hypothetical protein